MDEWKEGVWLGVSAFITAMLITFATVLGSVSHGVARMQQEDINAIASMEEYRKWVKYDNVIVNQADVINCILENRTQVPSVTATANPEPDNPNAPFVIEYLWYGTNPPIDYSADALNMYIPPGATYRARLIKDGNGAVLYIWFRRIT